MDGAARRTQGDRGSDINHVVVGPTGVYTINTKHHPNAKIWVGGNTFMVNDQRQPYVRNSRFEAERTAKFLTRAAGEPVTVTGVIILVGVGELTVKTQPDGVFVLTRMSLRSWLESRADVLSQKAIDTLTPWRDVLTLGERRSVANRVQRRYNTKSLSTDGFLAAVLSAVPGRVLL